MSWQGTIKRKTQRKKLSLSEVRREIVESGKMGKGKGAKEKQSSEKNYAPDAAEF